jgi:uncharacterized protein (DUF1499 family)
MLPFDQLRDALTRNRARTRPDHPDPRLRGRVYPLAPDAVWEAAARLAADQPGWQVTDEDAAGGRIRAEATTTLWRFTDDIEIEVRPADGGATRVDLRSASRVGRSDLGANARRIARFLQNLDARLSARAGGRG